MKKTTPNGRQGIAIKVVLARAKMGAMVVPVMAPADHLERAAARTLFGVVLIAAVRAIQFYRRNPYG